MTLSIKDWPRVDAREFYEANYANSPDESALHAEMYWSRDFSAEKVSADLIRMASRHRTRLDWDEDWAFEDEFYAAYQNDSDRSLS